ncbi:MAG: hypothetical protein VCA73_01555 [Roseibacillus sp.]|jgi:hypothetical protein
MLRRVFVLLLLLPAMASAVTLEVVKLYQPLSLHNTDGVGEEQEGEEPIQAAVLSRPFAISGAIPEDLVKAVATPHKISSNTPAYDVKDANLLNLCKVALTAEMKNQKLLVRLDVSKLELPEDLDLTGRQVVRLSINAIRRTLKDYFREIEEEEAFEVSIGVIGTNEGNAALEDMAVRFKVGE